MNRYVMFLSFQILIGVISVTMVGYNRYIRLTSGLYSVIVCLQSDHYIRGLQGLGQMVLWECYAVQVTIQVIADLLEGFSFDRTILPIVSACN